jgi:hypothetical protein
MDGTCAMLVISGNDSSVSACFVNPASLSHAGVFVRTNQSAAMSERRSSKALLRVPMSRGMRGLSRLSLSASFGRASFHERMKAEMTGHTHSGESDHGSLPT